MDMKRWNVVFTESVGDLKFGMDRKTVWTVIGKPIQCFRKSQDSANTTDAYTSFHVYYTADDKLEAVEFFGKDISLIYNAQQLYPGTLSAAQEILPDLKYNYGSWLSRPCSIGIGAEEDAIDSVLVGCKDYYHDI